MSTARTCSGAGRASSPKIPTPSCRFTTIARTGAIPGSFTQDIDTYDLDFQHRRPLAPEHDFLWGFGYRFVQDDVANTPANAFLPPRVGRESFNAFAQDEIALSKDLLHFTIGTKVEHNDYTGFEVEPSARLAWTPDQKQTVWGAVFARRPDAIAHRSRSVFAGDARRIGSRAATTSSPKNWSPWNWANRVQLRPELAVSLATFFNDYDDLRSLEPLTPPLAFPVEASSGLRGRSTGAELTMDWRVTSGWRLRAGVTELRVRSEPQPATRIAARAQHRARSQPRAGAALIAGSFPRTATSTPMCAMSRRFTPSRCRVIPI